MASGDEETESYRSGKYFSSVFSEEDVVLMLEEYNAFVKTHQNLKQKKWVEFRKQSTLSSDYTVRQISEKIRKLQKGYENKKRKMKMMGSSPPHDPHQSRVFHLSESLWGDNDDNGDDHKLLKSPTPSTTKRRRVEIEKEKEDDLGVREVDLYYRKILLQQEECQIKLEILMKRPHFDEEKNKLEKNKVTPCQKQDHLVPKAFELKDEDDDCKQERSKNLEADEGSEKELMDDDLQPISCVKDKINEDPPSDSRSVRKKKTKKKKKKSRKESDRKKGKHVAIEELSLGDPNGKFVSSGMKVKIHCTAKLKDSGHVFESTIGKPPRKIILGNEQIIDGISIGMEGMRVGGKRRLIIPPSYGFGEEGFDDVVPPNSWLEYEIELLSIHKTK